VDRPDTRAIWDANAPDWIELSRAGFDVYRDLVNTPAFLALLPPVDGLRCLDLGCGEGHNTRLLAARGARVVGLDISEVFVDAARTVPDGGVRYVVADGTTLPFAPASFDAATAFMSLMDVADPEGVLGELGRVVRPGGLLQFSVVHPATSTPVRRWVEDEAGERQVLAIGGYFYQGPSTSAGRSGRPRRSCGPTVARSRSPTPGVRSRAGSTRCWPAGSPSRPSTSPGPTRRPPPPTPRWPTPASPPTS
jgi:SAM-dependent methyltransferase